MVYSWGSTIMRIWGRLEAWSSGKQTVHLTTNLETQLSNIPVCTIKNPNFLHTSCHGVIGKPVNIFLFVLGTHNQNCVKFSKRGAIWSCTVGHQIASK